jgi:nicotinamide-nucleotide amidase
MTGETIAAERLGEGLRERGETIAVAESCTGGLVGSTLTDPPGASGYFAGGIISYVNRTKRQLLAISSEALDRHGAVSEPVARAMAQHVRDETGADWGVSTTGYAGPAGGAADATVGTVYVGVASAGSERDSPDTTVGRHQFDGSRAAVRERATAAAIEAVAAALEAR